MKTSIPSTLALSFALLFCYSSWGQVEGVEYSWKEKRNKKGIVIQTSDVAGSSFKAVRGEMTVNASVESLYGLVDDLAACPDWADLCKEARLEKRVSPTENYAYIYNDVPFPVSDRDVYIHVVWSKINQRVTMTSVASEGGPPKHKKAVRIQNAISQWHFTPNEDGTTKVENFAHIDPNGPTPAWITNMLLVDSPYKSMSKMRKLVEAGKYENAVLPF